ncbi:MAG: protoheme IX farnesyltransferase [Gemmatimonadetes bacterium]|nr:protoheme IX farnesyltransferase [Gemmatimonadota bacterium]
MSGAATQAPARGGSLARATAYYELTKPGIAFFVVITVIASYYVAAGGTLDLLRVLHTVLGAAMGTAGALALNQYVERDLDARMKRTQSRPLPSGRLRPSEALVFGMVLVVGGVGYLGWRVGWLPALLTALSAAAYILAYTPLKTRSYIATLVGAVPGAIPALIGWSAATGGLAVGAFVLSAIAFLWQLPHVLALAWLLREDYARVGFFLMPPTDAEGGRIGKHMVYHSVSLLTVSAFPTVLGLTGLYYLGGAMMLGLTMMGFCIVAAREMTRGHARRVFLYSLLYQPLLLGLMVIDTIRS